MSVLAIVLAAITFQDILIVLAGVVVIGVLVWAINSLAPMDAKFKQIVYVGGVVLAVLWLFGVLLGAIRF
jgi:predicted tellurium resistance membrane protein TerC